MKPLVDILLHDFYAGQDQLAQLFITIGEMDTYYAIATKFVELQDVDNKLCFATYVTDAQRPTIQAQGFWNILVKKPVMNTVCESRNIMLTGPNAGGKTTSIRALLQNIILAQTFGIAAAEQFACTPFDVIHSYLNISDDIQNGLSLFASEIKRAQEIVHTIQTLQPHERYFFALDELFTSTVAEDGELCAYEFIKGLQSYNNTLFMYATHFNKVKELENESAIFVNYKIDDPAILEDGTLKYPFTISKGASRARFALHIARRAGLIK
jgi:DNA mismatch repair protein MutS